ncbi:hypothetical protein CBS101457_000197 [Exobasidium rhododendri]|nr:hypothetical protein CBS101457_000197 [Exobasidium rhododendri]
MRFFDRQAQRGNRHGASSSNTARHHQNHAFPDGMDEVELPPLPPAYGSQFFSTDSPSAYQEGFWNTQYSDQNAEIDYADYHYNPGQGSDYPQQMINHDHVSGSSGLNTSYQLSGLEAHDGGQNPPQACYGDIYAQHGLQDQQDLDYYNNHGGRGQQSHGLTPIPAAGEYHLQYESTVQPPRPGVTLYASLSEPQRFEITDRLCQIRPYMMESVQYYLGRYLTVALAKELLSNDEDVVDAAATNLLGDYELEIKSDDGKHTYKRTPWMTGLKNNQRKEAIRRLAVVTLQAADKLRDYFLEANVTKEVAQLILDANYKEEIWSIALENNLFVPPSKKDGEDGQVKAKRPWREGLSGIQRFALQQRIFLSGQGIRDRAHCYKLLSKPKIPSGGFGLMMLQADDSKFARMLEALVSVSRRKLNLSDF